jgi:hypothetical protein
MTKENECVGMLKADNIYAENADRKATSIEQQWNTTEGQQEKKTDVGKFRGRYILVTS